jgi:hypothetical protein
MGFAADCEAAVALLGGPEGDRVVDFLLDPGAACHVLDAAPEHGGVVVRAAAEVGPAAPGHGPVPAAPFWIRVMRGAREVGTAPLRGGDGMVRRADRVEIEEQEESCCDAPGCEGVRTRAAVWLVLDPVGGAPGRLLLAEQRAVGREAEVAQAVAGRVAQALGVALHRGGAAVEVGRDAGEPPPPVGPALSAVALARFGVQREGDRVVVRDWDSRGPRASAGRNAWIGAALAAVAAVAWFELWRSLRAGGGLDGPAIAAGVAGALFTVAAYAFLGVARFSAKYQAASAPLAAVGRDRIVVAPWVGRDGAVDARPEGRLGAAIPLGEVRQASLKRRGPAAFAVELDTDHGAIDAMVCTDQAAAELWCAVIDRAVDEARHPRQGATARQRARQRAGAVV